MKLPPKASRRRAVQYSIILTPLSLLLVVFLLFNQAAPIVYAQPSGWVELVGERTRTSKSFYDPSRPGVILLEASVAKVHYDGPNWKDIDNTLAPSLANVPTLGLADLEMSTDDYEFYALQTLNTIPLWFYRNKTVPDTYVTFNPQALQWTNDLDQIDQLSIPQSVIGTVTENRLHWESAYGQGINLTLSAQAGRLAKALTLETIPRAPAQYILDGGNPSLELGFIFDTPSGPNTPEIWVDGILWDESARMETVGVIEFRKNGETVFNFAEPTAFDSVGFGVPFPTFILTKQGPNLRIAIRVPLTFLQTATYPVFIDPTIEESIVAGTDDGYSHQGSFFDTSASLRVGAGAATRITDAWLRFQTIALEQGANIIAANFTVEAYTSMTPTTRTNIYANDVDDSVAPVSEADHGSKVRTAALTVWNDEVQVNGVDDVSPDIANVISEIVSRVGWSSGNSLMILWDDNETWGNASSTDWHLHRSYEATQTEPRLTIEWGWFNTAPIITNKISSETVDSNTSYNRSFSATDPDTNQTLQWELNATDTPFTITVWNEGNRTTYVTASPDMPGTYFVNVTVGDNATTGNLTDYVNYTLVIQEPILEQPETLLENALFFLVGFIPFLMAIGIGFWKEQGSMLFIGGLIGILLGLWVMVTVYWVFGFSFVGISILFMYIGWVNRDYMG